MTFDLSAALPTFVITLREGVEAALVVGIVLAYLQKAGHAHLNTWVYRGVGAGVLASALIGVLFRGLIQASGTLNATYAPIMKPALEGLFSVVAIAMLSWMLVWMTRQAKQLKSQVEGTIGVALQSRSGAAWGVFGLVFFAVLREGFETVLFLAAQFQAGWVPVVGAIAGLSSATVIGMLLFKWGARINLRRFFQVMGIFLLLIVAGLVISALRQFDAAMAAASHLSPNPDAWCFYYDHLADSHSCTLGPLVWDWSAILPDRQFPGILLKTLLGYRDRLYQLQAVAYLVFLTTVGGIYLQSLTGWTFRSGTPETTEPSVSPGQE